MGAAALARQIDVPTSRITEILCGRRSVAADMALRLGHFFGTSAEFWLNLQVIYELRCAGESAGEGIRRLPTLRRRETLRP